MSRIRSLDGAASHISPRWTNSANVVASVWQSVWNAVVCDQALHVGSQMTQVAIRWAWLKDVSAAPTSRLLHSDNDTPLHLHWKMNQQRIGIYYKTAQLCRRTSSNDPLSLDFSTHKIYVSTSLKDRNYVFGAVGWVHFGFWFASVDDVYQFIVLWKCIHT